MNSKNDERFDKFMEEISEELEEADREYVEGILDESLEYTQGILRYRDDTSLQKRYNNVVEYLSEEMGDMEVREEEISKINSSLGEMANINQKNLLALNDLYFLQEARHSQPKDLHHPSRKLSLGLAAVEVDLPTESSYIDHVDSCDFCKEELEDVKKRAEEYEISHPWNNWV